MPRRFPAWLSGSQVSIDQPGQVMDAAVTDQSGPSSAERDPLLQMPPELRA